MPKVAPKGLDPGCLPSEEFIQSVLTSDFCERRGVVAEVDKVQRAYIFTATVVRLIGPTMGLCSSVPSARGRLL